MQYIQKFHRIRYILFISSMVTLFFTMPLSSFASQSCQEYKEMVTVEDEAKNNEILQAFIQDVFSSWLSEKQKIIAKGNAQCKKGVPFNKETKEEVLAGAEATKESFKDYSTGNYFTLINFLYSWTLIYENSCLQKDVNALTDILERLEEDILLLIEESCYPETDLATLIEQYINTAIVMMSIREKDKSSCFWKEPLYTTLSTTCSTDAWGAISTSVDEMKKTLKNFGEDEPTWTQIFDSIIEDEDEKEAVKNLRKQRKEQGKRGALQYLNANLHIPFLRIQATASKDTQAWNLRNLYNTLEAQAAKDLQKTQAPVYSSNSLEIFSKKQEVEAAGVQVVRIHDLLANVSNTYGNSRSMQLSLEHGIHQITEDVKKITKKHEAKNPENTLYHFVDALKNTEKKFKYNCSFNDMAKITPK